MHAAIAGVAIAACLCRADAAPPTAIHLSGSTAPEGCPENTLVGYLSVTDPDAGDDHLFSLVAGEGDDSNTGFLIFGNQLILKYGISADFEAGPLSLSVRIRVTDSHWETLERVFIITMSDNRQEDADFDGLTEAQEEDLHGTSDVVFDSDGDGVGDGAEIAAGTPPKNGAIWPATSILGWGSFRDRQRSVPAGAGFVGLSTGQNHSLALKSDGSVYAWGGAGTFGQTSVPAGLSGVVAVSAGGDFWLKDSSHSLALRNDGTVVQWGYDYLGQIVVPGGLDQVKAIASGQSHCLALKNNGTVVAWGYNPHGDVSPPPGLTDVVAISAGGHHSLALKNDGTVVEWGHIFDGTDWNPARAPVGLCDVVAVSAGRYHDLALKSDGSVVAWGYNSDGQTDVPAGLTNVTAVAAGGFHSVALKSDGGVVAWGSDSDGQATVPPSAMAGVKLISAGMYHSLAVLQGEGYPAITSSPRILSTPGAEVNHQVTVANALATGFAASGLPDGLSIDSATGLIHGTAQAPARRTVRIEANTDHGLLTQTAWIGISSGLAPSAVSLTPAQVSENSAGGTIVGVLSAADPDEGDSHSFELIDGPGAADNGLFSISGNQLVTRANMVRDFETNPAGFSIRVRARDSSLNAVEQTLAIQFIDDRTEDADGDGLTEAAEEDVYGTSDTSYDTDGDGFGDGFEVERLTSPQSAAAFPSDPLVVAWGANQTGQSLVPAGLSGVIALSAGLEHSVALKSDGTVAGWGGNTAGQSSVPLDLAGVAAVEAGDFHTIALLGDGTVRAWGSNAYGQTALPLELTDIVSISAGSYHNLALKRDGTVVAWGWNAYGQATVPADLTNVVAVAAGGFHSLALKSDGTVVAWGSSWEGVTTVPSGLTGVTAIAAGGYHSLALKYDGTVVAWGANENGQCAIPADLGTVSAISAGWTHSLVLETNGKPVAWGGNAQGQALVPLEASAIRTISAGDSHNLALRQGTGFPAIANFPPLRASPGESVAAPVAVQNATAVHYSAMGLPAGLAINPDTGLISGTITTGERRAVRVMADTNMGALSAILWVNTADGLPPSEITLNTGILQENAPAGTLVGTLGATDPNPGDSVTFTLDYDLDAPDSFRFVISGNELRLSQKLTADYDAGKTQLQFRVTALDSAGNTLQRDFVIQMSDDRTEDGDGDGLSEMIEEDVLGTSDAVADNFSQSDSDGDGVPSLLEYAFNMNPKAAGPPVHLVAGAASTAGLPAVTLVSDGAGRRRLRLEYIRRVGAGLSYTPEFSSNATDWSAATQTVTVSAIDSQWERCVVEDALFIPETARRFARVRVAW